MKIRVMGTENECCVARAYYEALEQEPNVKFVQVSRLYPNRGSQKLFRLYVEVEYKDEPDENGAPLNKTRVLRKAQTEDKS